MVMQHLALEVEQIPMSVINSQLVIWI